MLDRASTFAEPEIVEMLKTRFVPVAIDQAYQRRQQDTEGEFYRKIAGQGPRNNFRSTTQGFYIATPSGELLLYNNNRDPEKLRRLMTEELRRLDRRSDSPLEAPEIAAERTDDRYNVSPPEGGLVIRVRAKVLDGYPPTDNPHELIFQNALSRDNMWITSQEKQALVAGDLTDNVARRLVRYHLIDNTRGEPPMWQADEIRELDVKLTDGKISGTVHLETADGKRGFEAELLGFLETSGTELTRFDVVALGDFWGEGRFTRKAPPGRFPLAVSFSLADGSDVADQIPPQGSRGWVDGYLR